VKKVDWRKCPECKEVCHTVVLSVCANCEHYQHNIGDHVVTHGSASPRGASMLLSGWLNNFHRSGHRFPWSPT
jgi:hypothetical protein